ncbi:hypothetical protein N2152v2_008328 [Parachlorella kessleri]
MCIPKHYVKPMPSPLQLAPVYDLDVQAWGLLYQGPASVDMAPRILYAPNSSEVESLMQLFGKAAACPADGTKKRNTSESFFRYFAVPGAPHECLDPGYCQSHDECYLPLLGSRLVAYPTAQAAEQAALAHPETVDAIIEFAAVPGPSGNNGGPSQSQLDLVVRQGGGRQRPGDREGPELDGASQPKSTSAQHEREEQRSRQQEQQRGRVAQPPLLSDSPSRGREGRERQEVVASPVPAAGGPSQRHSYSYTLRVNHTDVPYTRMLFNSFDVAPGKQYRQYWWFCNLQALLDQAILSHAAAAAGPAGVSSTPHLLAQAAASTAPGNASSPLPPLLPLSPSMKPFPWPAVTLDLGATAAALFFNLLLVSAFLAPTRTAVAAVVQEKELTLREGMRILGLQDAAYWASWAITHWSTMALSGLLCAVVGLYPFAHSSFVLMLCLYWVTALALLAFAYCITTFFSKARVAGTATALIYLAAMVPGYVMPSLQPYGGAGWVASCLLPPSALSLFTHVLVKHESVQQGLTWQTISQPVTVNYQFSATTVYGMLLLDVALYFALLWYLDKVMPSEWGQNLPFYFPLLPSYWGIHLGKSSVPGSSNSRHSSSPGPHAFAAPSGQEEGHVLHNGGARSRPAGGVAVRIQGLTKVFPTTDGATKVAVDGLNLDMASGAITALLGHNGAGKTTTISILTGLLKPTSGDALINGLSVRHDMAAIRHSLGVCPQFDVLWPAITVREHLELFAAIKGFHKCVRRAAGPAGLHAAGGGTPACGEWLGCVPRKGAAAAWGVERADRAAVAAAAAAEVGLAEKADSPAGDLSGGQRRKLSVALAFVGNPAVVILDEPTSGMDPYSRRFTWDVIRRRRSGASIILTTHSMEEADLLADRIAIMAEGRLAAEGTSLDLKSRYGVGYTLTLARSQSIASNLHALAQRTPSAQSLGSLKGAAGEGGSDGSPLGGASPRAGPGGSSTSALAALVKEHVAGAQLLTDSAGEVAFRLPREASPCFPALLRGVEARAGELGVRSYGMSVTTLEEVFLRVSESVLEGGWKEDAAGSRRPPGANGAAGGEHTSVPAASAAQGPREPGSAPLLLDGELDDGPASESLSVADGLPAGALLHVPHLTGWGLWLQQFRALFIKRLLCARRDRLAALVAVPILLVLVALWVRQLSARYPQQPPLALDRGTVLGGKHAALGASAALRANGSAALAGFVGAFPQQDLVDSGATGILRIPYFQPLKDTLDDYLLKAWYGSDRAYDAVYLDSLPDLVANGSAAAGQSIKYTLLVNQTAVHGLPAVTNQVHSALLRWVTGDPGAAIHATNYPLPVIHGEQSMRINEQSGSLLLVLCLVMAGAVLSASFAVFLVRERESRSKAVQAIAGTHPAAFWGATLAWDLLHFSLPAAGMLACFFIFDLPQFRGPRMVATAVLLWSFALAGLPLTYLLQFAFTDEMRALQRLNSIFFMTGYLGFLSTWIMDIIVMFLHTRNVERVNRVLKRVLQLASPHYCMGRGIYEGHLRGEYYDCGDPVIVLFYVCHLVRLGYLMGRGSYELWALVSQCYKGDQGLPSVSPWTYTTVGTFLVSLLVQAVAYSALTLLVEVGVLPRLAKRAQRAWRAARLARAGGGAAGYQQLDTLGHSEGGAAQRAQQQEREQEQGQEDEDVKEEREAVQAGRVTPASSIVLLDGVRKTYWRDGGEPVRAVRGLWAGVAGGECFGLLGVNGAGKTTTFSMLTGEIMPDEGDAYLGGHSLLTQPAMARRSMGYCPQFSALPGQMTGREVLRMYGRLRGLPEGSVGRVAQQLLQHLGLLQYADRACGTYSGGNKRKLSVAVSLVGGCPAVLMDEPSTGMDPGARRSLWGVIDGEVRRAGRTLVLSSHSMEECEAVCSRVGIMAAGRLRCLGTVQHLKSRFGEGYVLEMRTVPGQGEAAAGLVRQQCPGAGVREQDGVHLSFTIPLQGLDLPALFAAIEGGKEAAGIEEYSLSQATLEQVFIHMARVASQADSSSSSTQPQ